VLDNCLSWFKFVNTHLYHSRQLYNIHIYALCYNNEFTELRTSNNVTCIAYANTASAIYRV